MARKLLETDGIRGVAGQTPLDPPTLREALGKWVASSGRECAVLDEKEKGKRR